MKAIEQAETLSSNVMVQSHLAVDFILKLVSIMDDLFRINFCTRTVFMLLLVLTLQLCGRDTVVKAFIANNGQKNFSFIRCRSTCLPKSLYLSSNDESDQTIDVDFEPVLTKDKNKRGKRDDYYSDTLLSASLSMVDKLIKDGIMDDDDETFSTSFLDNQNQEILDDDNMDKVSNDISLIEFVQPNGNGSSSQDYIDCKVAFFLRHKGVNYAIGTPKDTQLALFCEGDLNDRVTKGAHFLDPDEDDNLELMEMAAAEFNRQFTKPFPETTDPMKNVEVTKDTKRLDRQQRQIELVQQLVFKRTPRTLTVQGNLDEILGDWEHEIDELKRTSLPILDLTFPGLYRSTTSSNMSSSNTGTIWIDREMNEEDTPYNILQEIEREEDDPDDDEYFDSFFKKELGENYRREFLVSELDNENDGIDPELEELYKLFNIPGMGTQRNDENGIKNMIDDMVNGNDLELAKKEEQQEEVALRLVGFTGPDGKAYSLVKMIHPVILVAKEDNALEPYQRLLLSQREADVLIPQLEEKFQKEFEEAGFKLVS